MEVKLTDKVKAAVEVDGVVIINMENSQVFESIGKEEAFIYIKNTLDEPGKPGREIKIRFLKSE
jgi:hypothetical protein